MINLPQYVKGRKKLFISTSVVLVLLLPTIWFGLGHVIAKQALTVPHGCGLWESNTPTNWTVDDNWESFEKIIDSREPQRIRADKKIWSKSLEDINLPDILIINNWISYAQITGDESYKKIYDKKINNNYVKNFLEDQLEFRQNQSNLSN